MFSVEKKQVWEKEGESVRCKSWNNMFSKSLKRGSPIILK